MTRADLVAVIERMLVATRAGHQHGAEITFGCVYPDRHANADEHPSASWSCSKRAWLCRVCGARGGYVDLARALGIDLSRSGDRRAVASYDYLDELGGLLYQVVRFEPKTFRQRRRDAKGNWIWNLDGVRRVPYRLPELLAAPAEAVVFAVEGERDVDSLRAIGLTATCNPGGAGKWRREYDEHLRGRHVVVIPDADEPGRRHADDVVRNLLPVAADVRRLALDGAKDVSDWLAAGHTADELLALAAAAPVSQTGDEVQPPSRRAVLVQFSEVQPEPVTWLWLPYIPRGKLTLLEGDPAAGKTWLALAIAAALSRGYGLPDADTGKPHGAQREPEQVIYLTAEDGLGDTLRPRLDAAGADASRVHALTGVRDGATEAAVTLRDIDVLDDALTRTGAALVVVDPIQGFLGAQIDMHRANEVRPILAGLAKLAERHSCAVLCIRHLSKANAERALYRGLGSIDFTAAARSVLLAGRDPNEPNRRALVPIKNSLALEGPALAYAIDAGRFEWCGLSNLTAGLLLAADAGDSERSARDEARDFLAGLLAGGPVPAKGVQKQARDAGIADATLRRAREGLVRSFKREFSGEWLWELRRRSQTESEHLRDEDRGASRKNLDSTGNSSDSAKMLKTKMPSDDERLRGDVESGVI